VKARFGLVTVRIHWPSGRISPVTTFEQMRNFPFGLWIFAGEHDFQTSRTAIFEDSDIDADYVWIT
jgi:hypothetical protein